MSRLLERYLRLAWLGRMDVLLVRIHSTTLQR
jgi:hypothetical protein